MNPAVLWAPTAAAAPPEPPSPPAPDVVWIGSVNYSTGRAGQTVIALVIHTMAGSLASCDSWFNNRSSQVSSQYGIGLNGELHQYVELWDTAWANGVLEPGNTWPGKPNNVNAQTVSIETEDKGIPTQPVTEAQYQSTLAACRLALDTYSGITWLLGHHCISPQSRPSCCGARWKDSGQFDRLARDLHLQARY